MTRRHRPCPRWASASALRGLLLQTTRVLHVKIHWRMLVKVVGEGLAPGLQYCPNNPAWLLPELKGNPTHVCVE